MSKMFKDKTSFDERIAQSNNIKQKYPDKIPIIIERSKRDRKLLDLDKIKYLVPNNITVMDCIAILRRRLNLSSTESIYMFCPGYNIILAGTQSIDELYNKYKDDDGFLYIEYCCENTFG